MLYRKKVSQLIHIASSLLFLFFIFVNTAEANKVGIENKMVPLRPLLQTIDAGDLTWDQEGDSVSFNWEDKKFTLWIGKDAALVSGETVALTRSPVITEGSTWVPSDFMAEHLPLDLFESQPEPEEQNEVDLLSLRLLLTRIGVSDLVWEQEEARVSFTWENNNFILWIDKNTALVSGKPVFLASPPVIKEGSTLVPADFVAEYFALDDLERFAQARILPDRGTHLEKSKRQFIVETALKYVGVPYVWGGTSPSGFDSSGFVWFVFKENGIELPRVSFDIFNAGKPIAKDELLPGDLVYFEGYRPGPSHGSIYIGDGKFIHSPSTGSTVSIANLNDPYYFSPRYYGSRRYID